MERLFLFFIYQFSLIPSTVWNAQVGYQERLKLEEHFGASSIVLF